MEQVIALYYDQIYKFCYWKTHSAVDAQDITQDTFIRFMDAAQTYSDIESPKALLYLYDCASSLSELAEKSAAGFSG